MRLRSRKTRNNFVWWHWVIVLLAFCVTLWLAWWQLGRFNTASGTYQNLGYAVQWPIYGIFIIVGYRKYRELERVYRQRSAMKQQEASRCEGSDSLGITTEEGITAEENTLSYTVNSPVKRGTVDRENVRDNRSHNEIPPGILPEQPWRRKNSRA